jgi:hypothetical protein
VARLSDSCGGGGEWKRSEECWVVKAGNCNGERKRAVLEVVMGFGLGGLRLWRE